VQLKARNAKTVKVKVKVARVARRR
jgi:hypothetical protein